MPYSPEDIVAYAFRTRARGYDRDEVDGFLDELADQIEQERASAAGTEERLTVLESQLAEAAESERALKRTLVTVQDAADRALADAREEVAELRAAADRDIAELRERTDAELAEQRARAEAEAAEVLAAARAEAAAERERVRVLQELDASHRTQLRDHLEGALAGLAALPDPFADLGLTAATAEADGQEPAAPPAADDEEPAAVPAADEQRSAGPTAAEVTEADDAANDPWRRTPDLDEQPPSDPTVTAADSDDTGDQSEEDRAEPPMWS